jgi:hypothetical protein
MANKTLGFLKIWLAEKLGLDEEGRGFYCRHNVSWHCANDREKHGVWVRSSQVLADATSWRLHSPLLSLFLFFFGKLYMRQRTRCFSEFEVEIFSVHNFFRVFCTIWGKTCFWAWTSLPPTEAVCWRLRRIVRNLCKLCRIVLIMRNSRCLRLVLQTL